MENGSLVETGQFGHVLDFVEAGRVHLLDVVLIHHDPLRRLDDVHLQFILPLNLDAGRHEAVHLVRDPDEPLGSPLGLLCGVGGEVPVGDEVLELRVVGDIDSARIGSRDGGRHVRHSQRGEMGRAPAARQTRRWTGTLKEDHQGETDGQELR